MSRPLPRHENAAVQRSPLVFLVVANPFVRFHARRNSPAPIFDKGKGVRIRESLQFRWRLRRPLFCSPVCEPGLVQ